MVPCKLQIKKITTKVQINDIMKAEYSIRLVR